jgi:hypothetical protein
LELLHQSQYEIYKEMKELQTGEARFAKSIDKLAPDLLVLICSKKLT